MESRGVQWGLGLDWGRLTPGGLGDEWGAGRKVSSLETGWCVSA